MPRPVEVSTYREWRPATLTGLADLLWHYDGPSMSFRKRILPSSRVELLVNFGEPYQTVRGAGPKALLRAWIAGPHTVPMVVQQPRRQHVMGVRLTLAGAHALLGRPLSEVANRVVDLNELMGRRGKQLVECLSDSASIDRRVQIASRWICDQAKRSAAESEEPAIEWVRAEIERSGGAVPIARLRDAANLSKARLVAGFRERVGLSPKRYGRVVRFRRATALLRAGRSLAALAAEAGYYDQPHMNAEFRALAGVAPRGLLDAAYPLGDGLTIADDAASAVIARAASR